MSAELFERATRKQYRFDSPNGQLATEDLWTLPRTTNKANRANLLDIAKGLSKQLKENSVDDELDALVSKSVKKNSELSDKFEIVKYILKVLGAEADAAELRKTNRDRRQKLVDIIAQKELEGLLGTDLEELKAMAASMEEEENAQ